jgi:hypothetical protein
MTFEDRVATIIGLGFTDRQARFLTLVALHGGYCLRRQYAAFAGVEYGKNVRDFLERLVALTLARRITFRRDRGHIYHLFARTLYAALDQQDNRNRRHVSPALIARRLMLLDFVLTQPERDWYVTGPEKVDLLTRTLGVPGDALPPRTCKAVQNLQVFMTTDSGQVHFVCLVTDPAARDVALFVREHKALLTHLPAHTLVIVRPTHISTDAQCRAVHALATQTMRTSPPALENRTLRWYFDARHRIEHGQLRTLSVADIYRYRACQRRSGGALDALYSRWVELGDASMDTLDACLQATPRADAGQVVVVSLPYRYEQFGDMPGIA